MNIKHTEHTMLKTNRSQFHSLFLFSNLFFKKICMHSVLPLKLTSYVELYIALCPLLE